MLGGLQGTNCIAFSLIDKFMPDYAIEYKQFNTVADITTATVQGEIHAAQIIYTALVSLASNKVPITAVSGQVNGGSDIVIRNDIDLTVDDWAAFKAMTATLKQEGKPFKIGSFFGSVQDIELRLQLLKYGIDPLKDVDILNVPYPGMDQALYRGDVDAVVPVQPFGVEIELEKHGKHFAYPYDQAAGNLTNMIMVSQRSMRENYPMVVDLAKGMYELTEFLKTPSGTKAWAAAALKYSNVSRVAIDLTIKQLIPDYRMPMDKMLALSRAMFDSGFIKNDMNRADFSKYVSYKPLHDATKLSFTKLGA
ncbi:hypothetical protein BW247_12180 [Acidihalobacter ferrooxydans]|uniref:SsuA/THI5-like domain-containing protein n=1 Tax=Acidihalobacter ferrooxydans TaxID=1765967 RepID=A0A1P8UIU7_9GAMM|nr:hypothetical protein BW247_12180 [Acidihalobacter ferrooxydans]